MTGGAAGSLLAQLLKMSDAERSTLLVAGAATLPESLPPERRRGDGLRQTLGHADAAAAELGLGRLELAAEELRLAHDTLGAITGRIGADEMLGHIFASFCIGK